MQENRSFDHYFGTMRGVRGYGDPHPAMLPNGKSVWRQPDGKHQEVLPFRPDLDGPRPGVPPGPRPRWSRHARRRSTEGSYDRWMPAKGTPTTMAHLRRSDIPFHYALADAFTVCDAYHCSMLGPTDPNRYYMWTGWAGNDGKGGGPVLDNAEAGYDWTTYPERLQKAGVDLEDLPGHRQRARRRRTTGAGPSTPTSATTATTRCCTSRTTRTPRPASPLYERARTGTDVADARARFFDQLADDVQQRHAAAGLVDRRARGVHRAPELAGQLRRLVHLEGPATR